ncbi:MAG: glycosyltransferase family 1 protein [Candidatus Abyssobacteria bacterium SURF_17]|uniref:Glycosyltransferase family 1 protein n=1 Tax=Candidatus Abyssobacteria bacterium SURF_17 TaxID=2093361 RepID=A0A419EZY5_9BACT|nr:MAG: glycosyltransferase family 1 protein [Candidatus Abyssubacteria bacterium SURF_17]
MLLKSNDLINDNRVRKESRSLSEAGHEVTVLARKYERSAYSERIDGVNVIRIPWILGDPRRLFIEKAIEIDADVYHAHDLSTLDIAFVAARATGARIVYDSHELWHIRVKRLYKTRPIRRWSFLLREKHLIGKVDRIITVSDPAAELLKNRYRLNDPVVIRNVPPRIVPPAPIDLRPKLHISDDKVILLHLGMITQWRGFEQMLEVLAINERFVLVAIGGGMGDGVFEEKCRQLADRLGVRNRFKILNAMPFDEMIAHARGADVGMCLTQNISIHYYTTLSNKFFDYFLAGLPVIASDFPVMSRLIEHYEVGKVVDPSDPKDINLKLNEMFADSRKYDAMRRNCLSLIEENNWERESKKLVEMYSSLVPESVVKKPMSAMNAKSGSVLFIALTTIDSEMLGTLLKRFPAENITVMLSDPVHKFTAENVDVVNTRSLRRVLRACTRKNYDMIVTCYQNQGFLTLLMYDLISFLCRKREQRAYFPFIDLDYPIRCNVFLTERFHLNKLNTRYYLLKQATKFGCLREGFFI